MSTETTNKKIKIDNGTTFGRTYTDKAIDAKLPTDLIATAKKLSLGAGNTALGNGVNLDGFTYDEATKTLKASGGGITTANINSETLQLDTSSLTAKDQYVLAGMDDGEGNISYVPLQTYFLSDGYFNKEVSLQISSHDFRLSLTNVSFSSVDNYAFNAKNTNVDFTNTLDSTNTWTKLGDVKYITIEEQNMLTGESSHKYLEISGGSGGSIPILDITLDEANPEPLTDAQVNLLQANDGKLVIININFKADGTSLQATPTLAYILTSGPIIEFGGFKALICAGYFPYFNSINNFAWSNTYIYVNKDNTFSFVSNGFKIPNETEAGKVLMVSDSTYQDGAGKMIWSYEFKKIFLFGKYPILVPYYNNSTDTNILPLPADASTSTYVLKAVNGVIKWVKES